MGSEMLITEFERRLTAAQYYLYGMEDALRHKGHSDDALAITELVPDFPYWFAQYATRFQSYQVAKGFEQYCKPISYVKTPKSIAV